MNNENNNINVTNRSVFIADNLPILEGINSRCVDLIYLDPPFNSNRAYSAPVGSKAAGASFKDAWTLDDIDLAWVGQIAERHPAIASVVNAVGHSGGAGDKSYIIFMARRLLEMRRILKDTGSIYLHCDHNMSHSLKMVMDAIFGKGNFRNEIVWCYTGPSNTKRYFPRKHDTILYYVKNIKANYPFSIDAIRIPYKKLETGKTGGIFKVSATMDIRGKVPEDWWEEKRDGMTPVGRIKSELTGYPTQKPLSLLSRIIKASTNEGDVVLDPFCGCATACVAAEMLQREWIGIDISDKAQELVKQRLEMAKTSVLAIDPEKEVSVYNKPPKRTDAEDTTVNPKEFKHVLFGKQDGECAGCKGEFRFRNLTVDHIIPRAKAGGNQEENLQLLCHACNSLKGPRSMDYLIAELAKQGITNY